MNTITVKVSYEELSRRGYIQKLGPNEAPAPFAFLPGTIVEEECCKWDMGSDGNKYHKPTCMSVPTKECDCLNKGLGSHKAGCPIKEEGCTCDQNHGVPIYSAGHFGDCPCHHSESEKGEHEHDFSSIVTYKNKNYCKLCAPTEPAVPKPLDVDLKPTIEQAMNLLVDKINEMLVYLREVRR